MQGGSGERRRASELLQSRAWALLIKAVRPDLGEDKEAGVAAAIRQTGLRLRNYGLGDDMAAAGRMKRAWGGMSRWAQASSQDAAYARSVRLDEGKEAME